jgi:SsrA-binding protein
MWVPKNSHHKHQNKHTMNKEQELIRKKSPVNIRNKKASFEYFFIDTCTAGIVLTGTEIKSVRMGKASLADTFCFINNGEIWVKGMNISPYFYGSYNNHEARRDRKLLLNKREIQKLQSATKQTGYTIVPLLVFIDANGRAKMDIALCKGKKDYDKRQTLKEKEDRREMDRAVKHF